MRRTLLTLLFPGKVSGHDIEKCLAAALDVGRSNATVSHLLHEAGRRAGEILAKVDHSPLGPVVLARDELFTGRNPNLLLVEPRSLVTPHLRWVQVSLGCMPPKTAMPRPFDKLKATPAGRSAQLI